MVEANQEAPRDKSTVRINYKQAKTNWGKDYLITMEGGHR